jgi:hypothetical protein
MCSDNVYAVFTPTRDHWWCRFLHQDYGHCYLIKAESEHWIVYGKTTEGLDLMTLPEFSASIEGVILIKARVRDNKRGLFMLNTCVGHVKQAIGIRNPFIFTPFQLYKYLRDYT